MTNPWRWLRERPHITLVYAELPDGEKGRCYPDLHTIVLDSRLTADERNTTLMHERVHYERGDRPCASPVLAARQERSCEAEATRLLLPLDGLADALLWALSPEEVADALRVEPKVVRTRIKNLTAEEKDYIERRIAEKEQVA